MYMQTHANYERSERDDAWWMRIRGVLAHPVAYFTSGTLLAVSAWLRAHGRVNQTRAARL